MARARTGLVCALAASALLGAAAAPPAQAGSKEGALRARLSRSMNAAGHHVGAYVIDVQSGTVLFNRHAAIPRVPASNEKLITSVSVLERFGPAAKRRTVVLGIGAVEGAELKGDLYLKGFGDPSLGGAGLRSLAGQLYAAGLRGVSGRVYGDESYFDTRRGSPGTGFAATGDLAPLSALAFNHGFTKHGLQRHPAIFAATRFAEALRARGVKVPRKGGAGRTPDDARELARVRSPRMSRLVRDMDKPSDNYIAELLAKNLGKVYGPAGSTAAGAGVMRAVLRGLGVRARISDGSGLSRANRVAPRELAQMLAAARKRPWFEFLNAALPIAGQDGTLGGRMRGTAAQGRVRAKTGTLSDTSALSGYVRTRSRRVLVFSILMNRVSPLRARRLQDRMAIAMAIYSGQGGP